MTFKVLAYIYVCVYIYIIDHEGMNEINEIGNLFVVDEKTMRVDRLNKPR